MKFNYIVQEAKSIEIDFQDIFDYIKSEDPEADWKEIMYIFSEDIEYYLKVIYKCMDLEEEYNEYELLELNDAWEAWVYSNNN